MRIIAQLILIISACLILVSCQNNKPIENVADFSTSKKGDFLLFHFIDPYDTEGYILEVNDDSSEVEKYMVSDSIFAPSINYYYDGVYYFISGAYSDVGKILSYNPQLKEFRENGIKQEQFIDKFYKDEYSSYMTTILNQNGENKACDLEKEKCISFRDDYSFHSITSIKDSLLGIGYNINGAGNEMIIKKYNRNFEELDQVTVPGIANYFTYKSNKDKLYLFLTSGKIIKVDQNLKYESFDVDLTALTKNINSVEYGRVVETSQGKIAIEVVIPQSNGEVITGIASISLDSSSPDLTFIKGVKHKEAIVNVDYDSNELYTRFYENGKTHINIRSLKSLDVKKTIHLKNDDPISFVDSLEN